MPSFGGYDRYSKLDVATNTVTTVNVGTPITGLGWATSMLFAGNGKLYHVWNGKLHVLNVTNSAYPMNFALSRYFNPR